MNQKMKQIPLLERPRERLLHKGVENLTNQDLLAIILKTGSKGYSVYEVALEVLNTFDNLSNLSNMTISKVMSIKGIGKVKAMELICCLELGKRIYLNYNNKEVLTLNNPQKIWESMKYIFYGKQQEYFYCLYFNHKQELIERRLLFMGTINRSIVHPREVFKEAYLLSASSIVCMHNHPSNDLKPSREDLNFTSSLVEIGKIQGIPILDHIIVGEMGYYSFYENHIL